MIVIVLMIVRIVWLIIRHCLDFELGKGNGQLNPMEKPDKRGGSTEMDVAGD